MMKAPQIISGNALVGEELAVRQVDIIIQDGIIIAIEENPRAPPVWICPSFFNAHTHLGDTVAMDYGVTGDLVSLVTPPHGLKHQILAKVSKKELVRGMRASIMGMISSCTNGCADFREGGREGVYALMESCQGLPFRPVIFGREGGESVADGLGISSVRDVPDAEQQVKEARSIGKLIAFHAGERDGADVDAALAFDPDLLVHATHATKRQLRECADKEIPIVICPRSNWTLGATSSARHPPVTLMQKLGCTIYLGTDNVMFVPPDLFTEMSFSAAVYHIDPVTLLRSAIKGSEMRGAPGFISPGARANFFTINPARSALSFSRDPVTSIVKRASSTMIGKNVFNL
jgi:cytosine/adenosine deaminase-related metal-dependent hydrolase